MSHRRPWPLVVAALLLGAVLALAITPLHAGGPPGQINFQSKLTDASGKPVPDGTVAQLTFKLYSDSTLATAVWTEVQTNVAVSRGIVSVQLGKLNAIDPAIFDGGTKYLQIQVNTDPPLSPAVPFVSVPYALSAGSLNGKGDQQIVPVGTIVEWYRPDTTTLPPTNWKICDGTVVNDASSPFNGKAVPNLVGRFTRGLDPAALGSYGGGGLPDAGGQDTLNLAHSHNVSLPSHTHSIPDHSHTFSGQTSGPVGITQPQNVPTGLSLFIAGPYDHFHDYSGTTSVVSGQTTGPSSGANTQTDMQLGFADNRPAYVGLLKIIRIK